MFWQEPRFFRTFSSKWESSGPIYFLRWGLRRVASPSVGFVSCPKWIKKDLILRSMAVFSGALQFCREHDWAPSRKNARERAAISSRSPCPSLPEDVLWGSFVTHSFLLCGEATSALVPPCLALLYLLFSLNQNRQTTQARKKPLLPEKGSKASHYSPGPGDSFSLGSVFRPRENSLLVQTHPPHSRFFTEGRGSRGRNYTA